MRKFYEENKDRINAKRRADYAANPEKVRARNRASMTPEEKSEYNRLYHLANIESERRKSREYYAANKERYRVYERAKYQNDPAFRIRRTLGNRLREIVRMKGFSGKRLAIEELVGCDLEFAKSFIEAQFRSGMTWANYGTTWHIDHVFPCASFDLLDPVQQRACFHYSNLQPLFAEQNLSKSDTLPSVHQPFLL